MASPDRRNGVAMVLLAFALTIPGCIVLASYLGSNSIRESFAQTKGHDRIFATFIMSYPAAILLGLFVFGCATCFGRPLIAYWSLGAILLTLLLAFISLLVVFTVAGA